MSKATVFYRSEVTDQTKYFESKAERDAFDQRPQVEAAFNKITDNNKDLTGWFVENEDAVLGSYETGTISRVTKVEKNKLVKALEAIKAADNKDFAFVADNAEAIADSFRWPTVKRLTAEEKTAAMTEKLMAVTDNNKDLVAWIIANQEAIEQAYKAGVVKRPVSEKASAALAAYQAERKAKKEAEAAAAAKK
jgi:hypothetical protein